MTSDPHRLSPIPSVEEVRVLTRRYRLLMIYVAFITTMDVVLGVLWH